MGPNTRWLLEAEHSTGSVQSIDNYDITGDGIKDLIIGRHDGNIEVYAYDEGEDSEPILKYSHVCLFSFWHLTLSKLKMRCNADMCMCQSIFRIVAKVSTLLRVAWLAMLDLTKLWHRPIPVTTYFAI